MKIPRALKTSLYFGVSGVIGVLLIQSMGINAMIILYGVFGGLLAYIGLIAKTIDEQNDEIEDLKYLLREHGIKNEY